MTDYSNKKVLVVDDNKVNITITCNFLKPYKFNIDFCESGNPIIGHGKDLDTLCATAKAYINALNSFERMKNFFGIQKNLRYGGV